jgi:ubiquinone/menaquinone biosynthesis C-methylase UbiE
VRGKPGASVDNERVTQEQGRGWNAAVTRFWSLAAPAYDAAFLQRWVYRPAQDEVISALRTHGAQRIVDVACGTGILAARIADELNPAAVYGVDMAEGMLAQAKARSSAVQWLRGPAEQLPFDDGGLDAVVTTSAFHFFDQPVALREFHRVLTPGGLAAVATISPPRPILLGRFTRNLRNPAHNPSQAEMRDLFEGAGFTVRDQHRVRRPIWTPPVISDAITVGIKP